MFKKWIVCLLCSGLLVGMFGISIPTSHAASFSLGTVTALPNTSNGPTGNALTFQLFISGGPVNVTIHRSSTAGAATIGPFVFDDSDNAALFSIANGGIFDPTLPPNTIFTYQFNAGAAGSATVSYDCTTGAITNFINIGAGTTGGDIQGAFLSINDPFGDNDGDGVINRDDNCVLVPNADQANAWGDILLGDACDNSFYDNLNGIKLFQLLDGNFEVFSCPDETCIFVAKILTSQLTASPTRFQSNTSQGWFVNVWHVGTEGGQRIYQVTVHQPDEVVVEDTLFFWIGNNAISWLGKWEQGGALTFDNQEQQ